jgi:hypothetical protein
MNPHTATNEPVVIAPIKSNAVELTGMSLSVLLVKVE